MNCIFCKIISGDIPSYTLYEDDVVKVFLDVNPDSNGHCLVIPKKHTLDLDSIDIDTLTHVMNTAKKMRVLLESKLNMQGCTLVQNNGDIQEVKHFHLHIKPYYKNKDIILNVEDVYNKLKV